MTVKTLKMRSSVGVTQTLRLKWGFADDGSDLENCFAIYQAAKDAVTVVTAMSVLYELSGPEQKKEAAKLLSRERPELKKPILDALRKI